MSAAVAPGPFLGRAMAAGRRTAEGGRRGQNHPWANIFGAGLV
jgi:hypothetical protein